MDLRRLSRWLAGVGAAVKYAVLIGLFAVALGGAYLLGRSHAEVRIVKEQVEVVKYVSQKKAEIYAKPNAGRAELLKLMHDGKL